MNHVSENLAEKKDHGMMKSGSPSDRASSENSCVQAMSTESPSLHSDTPESEIQKDDNITNKYHESQLEEGNDILSGPSSECYIHTGILRACSEELDDDSLSSVLFEERGGAWNVGTEYDSSLSAAPLGTPEGSSSSDQTDIGGGNGGYITADESFVDSDQTPCDDPESIVDETEHTQQSDNNTRLHSVFMKYNNVLSNLNAVETSELASNSNSICAGIMQSNNSINYVQAFSDLKNEPSQNIRSIGMQAQSCPKVQLTSSLLESTIGSVDPRCLELVNVKVLTTFCFDESAAPLTLRNTAEPSTLEKFDYASRTNFSNRPMKSNDTVFVNTRCGSPGVFQNSSSGSSSVCPCDEAGSNDNMYSASIESNGAIVSYVPEICQVSTLRKSLDFVSGDDSIPASNAMMSSDGTGRIITNSNNVLLEIDSVTCVNPRAGAIANKFGVSSRSASLNEFSVPSHATTSEIFPIPAPRRKRGRLFNQKNSKDLEGYHNVSVSSSTIVVATDLKKGQAPDDCGHNDFVDRFVSGSRVTELFERIDLCSSGTKEEGLGYSRQYIPNAYSENGVNHPEDLTSICSQVNNDLCTAQISTDDLLFVDHPDNAKLDSLSSDDRTHDKTHLNKSKSLPRKSVVVLMEAVGPTCHGDSSGAGESPRRPPKRPINLEGIRRSLIK